MIDFNRAHKILGVNANANRDEIKSAYNQLSKTYHPDKYKGNDIKFANQQFSLINSAYKTMISPQYQNRNNNYQRGVFYNNRNIIRNQRVNSVGNCNLNRNRNNNPNGNVNVLCNGNVLMTGNFHPSKLTYEMLMNMRKNLK